MKKQASLLLVVGTFIALLVSNVGMAAAQPTTTLEQRLETYKKERNINTKQEVNSLKLRCGIAQAALKNLQIKVLEAQKSRKLAYKNIADILANLQTDLNKQAFETSTLKSVADTYNAKVAIYTADMDNYAQAVDDAITVDCAKDPYGFRGALETARLYHDRLPPDINDIRSYATNTVKSTLEQIKKTLASGNTTGGGQQ